MLRVVVSMRACITPFIIITDGFSAAVDRGCSDAAITQVVVHKYLSFRDHSIVVLMHVARDH